MMLVRWARLLATLVLAALLLGVAARLAFRPDARDDLRAADRLLYAGRYYDARAAYLALADRAPGLAEVWARLGIVSVVRGESQVADHAFVRALAAGARAPEAALIRLYQGQLAARAGHADLAGQFWSQIDPRSALGPYRLVLEAELALAQADYASAERGYRVALAGGLAAEWHALAYMRLALLRASSDPPGALAELAPAAAAIPLDNDWLAPLLPSTPDAQQLAGVLRAPPDQRAQLLGQIYLGARLYPLAEAQFAAVPSTSTSGPAAAAYAAYTRWSAGDRAEGQRQLKQLVARYPGEPRLRALLALVLLAARDDAGARAQLDMLQSLAPRAPDTLLAWGQWYTVQHDYAAAADAYMRARRVAPSGQRGDYALALARFYIDTEFQACAAGVPAAEEATQVQAQSPQAWAALAAARLGCGDAPGAQAAAVRALAIDAADAEAAYYLGRALAALGDAVGARQALVQAADAAPASVWRERAERQLALLGF
ncbi:MAG: hypothetical protein IPP13_21405 [Kouleothrix sp.]|jgi:Flp pilus assembly protein TadD|nr:hypothetical protein [Kouleothrix sp.]